MINSENTSLQEMAAQGQSFFISSGDSGSTMCYQATRGSTNPPQDDSLNVIDPGAQPFATGVGGTLMGEIINNGNSWQVPDNGTYPGEFVWNDGGADSFGDPASGTGGGVSDQWPMPSYQSAAAGSLDVVQSASSRTCGGNFCRQVPDVAADSDPNSGYAVFSTQGGAPSWGITGGTSAAAPLWAAMTALANASQVCRGLTVGFENPALYSIAGSAYAANFHDTTQGSPISGDPNNDTWSGANPDNPSGLYPVQAGYDMATGLGSPVVNVLGNSLCALRSPVYTVTVASPGNQLTVRGQAASLAIHGADSGGAALSYSASGLPAGLSINPSTGVISGTATTPQSTTVTVSAGDAFADAGSTSFNWSVVVPGKPQAKSPKFSGLGKGKPKLTFAVASGLFAPALKSVAIKLPGGLSFAKKATSLTKGITVRSGSKQVKLSAKVKGGALLITFTSAVTNVSVTLASPTISISSSEAAKIRQHKVKKLSVSLKATDVSRKSTSFSVTITKPS